MPDENEIEAQRSPAALGKGTSTTLLTHKKAANDTPPGNATPQKPSKKHAADESPADTKPLNTITNLAHTRHRPFRQTVPLPAASKKARLTGSTIQRKDSGSSVSPDTPTIIKQSTRSHTAAFATMHSSDGSETKQLTLKSAFAREHHAKVKDTSASLSTAGSPSSSSSSPSTTSSSSSSTTMASSSIIITTATPSTPSLPSDKELIKSLESKLGRLKQQIESAVNQLESDRAEMAQLIHSFTTEEKAEAESRAERDAIDRKALQDEILALQQLLETMDAQMDEREEQILLQKQYLAELTDNVHALEQEVYDMLLIAEEREALSKAEDKEEWLVMEKEEEIHILQEKVEETFRDLAAAQLELEHVEKELHADSVDMLRKHLKEREHYLRTLEAQIELEEDSDFVASLNLTVEEELAALKAQYRLTSGSELDKEVAKRQAKLQAKFDRDFSRLKQNHNVLMEQTEIKIRASEKRLESLNASIQEAIESTLRSEQDRLETEKLLEQENRRAEELERQIRELQHRVTAA
ncbi:hypothetical protein BGW41_002864 [Actinomortierella wolfii]|nr:hypothetical protein BGW41_002864 [Actinomortierella wolfii]